MVSKNRKHIVYIRQITEKDLTWKEACEPDIKLDTNYKTTSYNNHRVNTIKK